MRNLIVKVWKGEAPYCRAALFVPLFFVSCLYRMGLALRERLYSSGTAETDYAAIPVVSVGNVTLGGTGKTPVVERLALRLRERGFTPAIVTRGYRRKKAGVFAVDPRNDSAESAGDEPLMLARRTGLPVIVAKERIEAVNMGIADFNIDIAVLDDGFQVRNLAKDVEILILKGTREGERTDLFPLGPFREPPERAARADIVLVNGGEPAAGVLPFIEKKPRFLVSYRPTHLFSLKRRAIVHCNFMRGKRVVAFAGLGNNDSFFGLVEALGAQVAARLPFPDHHAYTQADLARTIQAAEADIIVTTEKDGVKLEHLDLPDNLFYLAVEAVIEGEERLVDLILSKVKGERQ
jgi:tetraacyldisaccharide 4'-kinase